MSIQAAQSEENKNPAQHNAIIQNRHILNLNGIEDVISFDENSILMRSSLGTLSIDGTNLRIVKLNTDSGEIIVEGTLNGLFYLDEKTNAKQTGGRLKKLFR